MIKPKDFQGPYHCLLGKAQDEWLLNAIVDWHHKYSPDEWTIFTRNELALFIEKCGIDYGIPPKRLTGEWLPDVNLYKRVVYGWITPSCYGRLTEEVLMEMSRRAYVAKKAVRKTVTSEELRQKPEEVMRRAAEEGALTLLDDGGFPRLLLSVLTDE